jgi:hypothetical protein
MLPQPHGWRPRHWPRDALPICSWTACAFCLIAPHALALHQVAGVHGGHHMHQRQELPGAALPVERNARQRAIQQGGYALGEFRSHLA